MSPRSRIAAAAAVIGALAVGAPVAGASAATTVAFPAAPSFALPAPISLPPGGFPGIVNMGPTGPMGPLGPHGPLGGNGQLPTGWDAWNLGPSGPLGPGGPLG